MSIYMTEEEQLAAIKKWWGKYSTPVLMVLSLLLLSVAGYRYWHWHQDKLATQASNAYEHLMVAFSNQDNQQVQAYANQLIKEYGQTVYADAARLTLAKLFVTEEEQQKAIDVLKEVVVNTRMTALTQVAKIRIARLLVAQKEYSKALAELNVIVNIAYEPVVNELKGDIYALTGNYQKALAFYKEATAEVNTKGMGNLFLEMKTNELTAQIGSA